LIQPRPPARATKALLQPGSIGPVAIRNRLVRAGTSETLATRSGEVTEPLVTMYRDLAVGGVGLIFTGHLYIHPRGQSTPRQAGIWSDEHVPGLRRLVEAAHEGGAKIFAQLGHAGAQSRVTGVDLVSPSGGHNAMTGRHVAEASEQEIEEGIRAYVAAAQRAMEAGFDGIHIQAAIGYLMSEFMSPLTNLRTDRWGGSPENRSRFPLEVVKRVRDVVSEDRALIMKMGLVDFVPGQPGLELSESLPRAQLLIDAGLDGFEVSVNVTSLVSASVKPYVGIDRRRAAEDLLFHRLWKDPGEEAYFRSWARAMRERVDTKIVLVGGLRRTQTMEDVLESGDADFIAMARPFIREPDLANKVAAGRTGLVDCVSCNICLMHEGHHPLQCWRIPRRRLLRHALYRFTGGLKRGELVDLQAGYEDTPTGVAASATSSR